VARWQPGAHGRLQQAAFELFEKRGFEDVTVAEIAERAGLTGRTFFRYFADKREVLFAGSEEFEQGFAEAVEGAPAAVAPLEAIGAGLGAVADFVETRREVATRRQQILDSNPELQERERTKLASLAVTGAEALRRRGVTDLGAAVAAEAGVLMFQVAFRQWVSEGGDGDLHQLIDDSLTELRAVTVDGSH